MILKLFVVVNNGECTKLNEENEKFYVFLENYSQLCGNASGQCISGYKKNSNHIS